MLLIATALALAAQTQSWDPGGRAGWTAEATQGKANAVRLEDLARHGNRTAMRQYGLMLWEGDQVRRDREAALGWFYEAAIRNDAPAMYMLGVAFERGDGVGRDLKLSDYWTNRAIKYGYKIPEGR